MLLRLEQLNAIDPDAIWWEITPADIERATPNPQLYANPTGVDNALMSQLCMDKFQTWLTEQQIPHRVSSTAIESATIWDTVIGSAIKIGETRVILIPSDTIDRAELRVPQEWVDLPNWVGDYYLGIQVDLESNFMNIWGFTSHKSLKEKGRYDEIDRSYSLNGDRLVGDLNLLWVAEELDLAPRNIVDELSISLDRALELIKGLSKPSAYSPRLAIDFGEWGAILNNLNLRSQLYQTRLQSIAISQAPAPSFSLVEWVRQEFNNALASGWENHQAVTVRSPSHNNTIERSKLINLQVNLEPETIILLVGVVPASIDKMRVFVRVHPAIGSRYLPAQLELSYLDESGVSLRTVTARTNDNYIQLPAYTCPIGMEFNVQVKLNHARSIERFVV
jgi:hypothetical protein